MLIIIEHAEVMEAIKLYLRQKYGVAVDAACSKSPYTSGRQRQVPTAWAVEKIPRPKKQLRSAAEIEEFCPNPALMDGDPGQVVS